MSQLDAFMARLRPVTPRLTDVLPIACSNAARLVEALANAPQLAERALSAARAAAVTVNTIEEAIDLLGVEPLERVLLASALRDCLGPFRVVDGAIWQHGIATGLAGVAVAGAIGASSEDAFCVGLTHDVGQHLMRHTDTAAYREVDLRAMESTYIDAERAVFGFDHSMLGQRWLEQIGVNALIANIVGHGHEEQVDGSPGLVRGVAILDTAHRLAESQGYGPMSGATVELQLAGTPAQTVLGLPVDEAGTRWLVDAFWRVMDREEALLRRCWAASDD